MEHTYFEKDMERLVGEFLFHVREYYRLRRNEIGGGLREPKAPAPLSLEAGEREKRLREWRGAQSRKLGLPAYLILPNRTLRELAEKAPVSMEELLALHGIGPRKAAWLGGALLATLAGREADLSPPGV